MDGDWKKCEQVRFFISAFPSWPNILGRITAIKKGNLAPYLDVHISYGISTETLTICNFHLVD
jgi:hypothetical protein